MMMTIKRGLAVAVVMAGAGVAMAGPAWADDPNGSYTATSGRQTTTVTFTPCGPDCIHMRIEKTGAEGDLHRQGDVWVGSLTAANGDVCTETLGSDLVLNQDCPAGHKVIQLTKNG